MFNDPYYADRIQKLAKFLIDFFGYKYFYGKSVLDLGAGHGDIAASLWRLGAKVIAVDSRNEHLKIVAKKYPGMETKLCDLDKEFPFRTFDMVLNLDLINHLKNWESHLTNSCNAANHIIVETACSDSDDPNFCLIIPKTRDDYDGSHNGYGSYPTAANIEAIFTATGMSYERFDYAKFGFGRRSAYDWRVHNTKSHSDVKRRLWIATRTVPSTQSVQSLVGNTPTPPGQSIKASHVFIDPKKPVIPPSVPAPRYNPPVPDIIPSKPPVVPTPAPVAGKPKMRLFYNYYEEKNPERKKEIDLCLQKNISNPCFDLIVLDSPERPTYNWFFSKINQLANDDDVSIFCNSDIWFDGTIELARCIGKKEIFALSRYDYINENRSDLFNRKDSQDAWIVRGKVKNVNGDFRLGFLGCDNKIADLFARAGYKVSNPSLSIKTHHVHSSGIRTYSEAERLPGPYLFIPLRTLEDR